MPRLEMIAYLITDSQEKCDSSNIIGQIGRDLPEHIIGVESIENITFEVGSSLIKESFFKILADYDAKISSARKHIDENCRVVFSGKRPLVIASMVGRDILPRQGAYCKTCDIHFVPFHEILPSQQSMYITESLHDRVCQYVQEESYSRAHERLVAETGSPNILCRSEMRKIAVERGQQIRKVEEENLQADIQRCQIDREEIALLMENKANPPELLGADSGTCTPPLPAEAPSSTPCEPPLEVSRNAIKGSLDGVLVRKPEKGKWNEICVADVRDKRNTELISNMNWVTMIQQFIILLTDWGAASRPVILFVDGAKILKVVLETLRHYFPEVYLILDWYHLAKKIREKVSSARLPKADRQDWCCNSNGEKNNELKIITLRLQNNV
jgi:hypothetical protein